MLNRIVPVGEESRDDEHATEGGTVNVCDLHGAVHGDGLLDDARRCRHRKQHGYHLGEKGVGCRV